MPFSHKACLPFMRPLEPNFTVKDDYQFDLPQEYLSKRFQDIGVELQDRFGDENTKLIPVKTVKLPDLSIPMQLERHRLFSVFIPHHLKMADELMKIFMKCEDVEELISVALYARDRIHPLMFAYCYSIVLSHRPDTQNITLPNLYEIFPLKFVSKKIWKKAREEAFIFPEELREPIDIPVDLTATDAHPEHCLDYFRQDIGINSHHWHWHLIYPTSGSDRSFFDKDRRGELFYSMHHQILARYNTERLCNRLNKVDPIVDFRKEISDGFFPKMTSTTASRSLPPRLDGVKMCDVIRDQDSMALTVGDVEQMRNRVEDCIDRGSIIDGQGKSVPLDNDKGIDILGNVIEAGFLSPNQRYCGSLHNMGHVLISMCHDPINKYREEAGIMADTTTAMRDPAFYRWHQFVDNLFERHKMYQQPYTADQLNFRNVKIDKIELICNGRYVNTLKTFWQKSDANLSSGLDFAKTGPIYVRFRHLNHEEFQYKITVTNSGNECKGTVRIFIISTNNETGQPYLYEGGRKMAIEMDKFVVKLRPGINKIIRRSSESSVTIPFNQTFPVVTVDEKGHNVATDIPLDVQQYCSCGWPQHMLVPRGTTEGYPMKLFCTVTDYAKDEVEQTNTDTSPCFESVVFCGLRNKKYPDARPIGFPFDRPAQFSVTTLADFLIGHDNMILKDIIIRHTDEVLKYYSANNIKFVPNTIAKVAEGGKETSTTAKTTVRPAEYNK